MIVRNSPRVPQPSAGEGREHSVRSRPKVTLRAPKHGAVNTEFEDQRGDEFANADALVIPATFGGIRGAIVARFIDFRSSFHGALNSQKEQPNNVA